MAIFETVLRSDLKKPVQVQKLTGNLFSADNGGNKITVEVLDNGAVASLSGAVMGYIIREDDATITVTGSLSENRASIVLPASAYSVVGQVSIVVKVDTTTVGACTAFVYRTTTDAIVDPGHVIPSISELLAKIGACETATANANKVANMTVSAQAATGTTPTVTMTEQGSGSSAHKHLTFGLVPGVSPTVAVSAITGGHRLVVTDFEGSRNFDVMDGLDSVVTNQTTYYATSSSGQTAPSDGWQTSIPAVSPGECLWTKQVITWADGTTTEFAFSARFGVNGTGSITSITMNGQPVSISASGVADLGSVVVPTVTLAAGTDLNTVVTSGFYRLATEHTNAPDGADYSQMIVSRGSDTVFQIVGIWGTGKVWTRTGNNIGSASPAFTNWVELTNKVSKSEASQWINSGTGSTALGIANNVNGHSASLKADSEGGNVVLSKSGKYVEFDTYGMMTDGSGYARVVVDNASSYKTFKFQQDGNFVDGNNISTGGLNRDKLNSSAYAIVQNGSTATMNIAAGKYVIWDGSLYMTSQSIDIGDTLSSYNLTAMSEGGLNDIASNLTLKAYSGTTGTSLFQSMYYTDISVSSGESSYGTVVGFYIDNVGNNHPAYAQRLANGSIRVYSPSSEKTFTLQVLFSKLIVKV